MGSNLSLPSVCVCWFGWGGLRWKELLPFFSHSLRGRAALDVLLIHCGGNDMEEVSRIQLVNVMKEDLHQLKLQHEDHIVSYVPEVPVEGWCQSGEN